MKHIIKTTLLIATLLSPFPGSAQPEKATSGIAALGRYTATGIELRWIPDNKTIMHLGFANSYTIERSSSGTDAFEMIAATKTFSRGQWDSLINNEQNAATRSNLELAMDFLFANPTTGQQELSLEEGIAQLNERKSKEDMIYAVFVLTAIKDAKVAEALGLGYMDKAVENGETYTYRIKLNATSPVYEIEDGLVSVKASINPDSYKNEVFVYPGDKILSFAWSSTPELAGYFVERADEGKSIFTPLNTTPFYVSGGTGFEGPLNGAFMDDSLTNYKRYRYRFYGITAFGDKVLFAEVEGMPRDLTPPNNPVISQPKHLKPKEVLVTWEQYGDTGDLKGFIVARSDKDTGNFTILNNTLLPQKARSFSDTGFSSDGLNYYIIYAIDTAGNLSSSYPAYVALVDSTPPLKPEILSALIDSSGVVTLTVRTGTEKDLMGYRLFKANSAEHEFSVIEEAFKTDKDDTTVLKLVFTDTVTLQSLTPDIYYRVKALDFNYNQSGFSDIAVVKRPDTIPPVTPVFTDVLVREKEVELHFAPSSSRDVKEHLLYRKTDMESGWELLGTMDSSASRFVDEKVTTNVTYYYSIRAKDQNGLYSPYASAVYGKPYDSGIRPAVEDFGGYILDDKVVLSWSYPVLDKEVFFVIYKKNENGQLLQYKVTTEKTFNDSNAQKKNSYAIKAKTKDGGQSKMSEVINVK